MFLITIFLMIKQPFKLIDKWLPKSEKTQFDLQD